MFIVCLQSILYALLYTYMDKKLRYAGMAQALGISERLLKNWVRDRVVPFIKIKRVVLFDPVKVEAALGRFERCPRWLREASKQAI